MPANDLRSSHMILEDVSSQAGVPLHRALEGQPAAGKNAHGALTVKDNSGNLQYFQLNAAGELPVAINAGSGQACLSAEGGVAGSTSFQTLATITLTNDAVYKKLGFMGSCFRDAVYEVVQINDSAGTPVETVHATFRTGAGQLNHSDEFECKEFTAGPTGVCILIIRAKQLQNASSDIDGMIAVHEQQ